MMLFALLLGAAQARPLDALGRAYWWLQGHVWLGMLSFPIIILHGGFKANFWGGVAHAVDHVDFRRRLGQRHRRADPSADHADPAAQQRADGDDLRADRAHHRAAPQRSRADREDRSRRRRRRSRTNSTPGRPAPRRRWRRCASAPKPRRSWRRFTRRRFSRSWP